jgi:uncharacterized membrane protein YhaH (DUF805 family)
MRESAVTSVSEPAPTRRGTKNGALEMDLKFLLLSADGRIKRQPYWIGWVVLFAVGLVGGLILQVISPYAGSVISLLLIYPNVCLYSKRLHDLGQTGWLAAIPFGLSALTLCVTLYTLATTGLMTGGLTPGAMGNPMLMLSKLGPMMAVSSLTGLIGLVFWLWLGIAEGQQGSNKYGAEPGSADSEVF